jgi:ubiquinol-cytochrome c reductase iron-sulfur subunit
MNRRLLLQRIVGGFAAVGGAFAIYPFIKAWLPDFAPDPGLDVSVADLAPGESRLVRWLGRKVIVQRRSTAMLQYLAEANVDLKDPESRSSSQPDFGCNAFRSRSPEVFVAFNNCTHLGCEVAVVNDRGIGFRCPCHNSSYDFAGRVLAGAAAPSNLEVPYYRFVSGNTLRLDVEEAS